MSGRMSSALEVSSSKILESSASDGRKASKSSSAK